MGHTHDKALPASNAASNGEAKRFVLQYDLLAPRQHYSFGFERLGVE